MNKIKFFTFENEKMKKIEKSQKIQIENLFDCSANEFIHLNDNIMDFTPATPTSPLSTHSPFASEISFEMEEENRNSIPENKISTFDENIMASLLPITQLSPAVSDTRRSISFDNLPSTSDPKSHIPHSISLSTNDFQSTSSKNTSPSPLRQNNEHLKSPSALPPPPIEIQTVKYASDRRLPHYEESKLEEEENKSVSSLPTFSSSQLSTSKSYSSSSEDDDGDYLKTRDTDVDRVSVSVFTDVPGKKDGLEGQDDEEEDFLLKQILTTPPQKGLNVLVKQGYLTKKGAKRRNWNTRWFILKHNYLAYYKNPGVCFPFFLYLFHKLI